MSEFALLYRSTNEAASEAMASPEASRQSIAKWQAWFKDMNSKGQLKDKGLPLERAGKVVGGAKRTVTDGPYVESKELVGGFSIIEAQDLEQAAKIASSCPILEVGGSVEVRPVKQLSSQ